MTVVLPSVGVGETGASGTRVGFAERSLECAPSPTAFTAATS